MDMFPVMETGFKNCLHNLSELKIPGVIDTTGMFTDPRVAEVSRQNFIPILPLSIGSALPPEVMAKILNQIVSDLKWNKIAIVHSRDEHSLHVVKLLGQANLHHSASASSSAADENNNSICFAAIESLPDPRMKSIHALNKLSPSLDSSHNNFINSDNNLMVEYFKIYDSIVSKLIVDTPIIIIGFDESIKLFTQAMIKRSGKTSQFQWVYSSMPEPDLLKSFGADLNNQRIYGMAPFPGKFAKFEEHWNSLQAPAPGPILGSWFDEYICHMRHIAHSTTPNLDGSHSADDGHCERSMAFDRTLSESDGDVLWRTYQVMPIIHSIFTFSHAIRNAWIDQCNGVRGMCPGLKSMSREHFIAHYLEPLQSSDGPQHELEGLPSRGRSNKNDRTPGGAGSENIGKLNWKLALTSFNSVMGELKFQQHILYDSLSNEAQILGKGFDIKASLCPKDGCKECVKIRQSRVNDADTMFHSDSNFNTITTNSVPESSNSIPESCVSQCSSCWNEFVNKNNKLDQSVNYDSPSLASAQSNSNLPPLASNFKRTWGIITSVTSGIGVLCVIICFVYFLMVFPVTIGTTILGYTILFGLLIIFSVNFLFIFPPNIPICWLRKIGMSIGYVTILSGMLVKAMNTWRRMTYKSKREGEFKISSPCSLFSITLGLITVHLIVTVVWLIVLPPKPGYYNHSWKCYPSTSTLGFLDTESLVSLLYIILLIAMTTFFCLLTWKCYDNNREPRYIMYSCSSVSVVWIIWSLCVYKMNKKSGPGNSSSSFESSRDVTIICANLACASIIMILLYIRKLYWYSKLRKRDRLIKERLQASAFPANFYGALHSRGSYGNGPFLWDQMSYVSAGGSTATSSVRGSITSLNTAMNGGANGHPHVPTIVPSNGNVSNGKVSKSEKKKRKSVSSEPQLTADRRPFEEDQMDTMSCGSASSSVQVQGTDLYPMEVYDGGSQFQPSSLYASNVHGAIYEEEI